MRSEIVRGHSINANIFGLARVACERMGGRGKEKVKIEEREGREEVKKQKEGLRKRRRRQKEEGQQKGGGRVLTDLELARKLFEFDISPIIYLAILMMLNMYKWTHNK